jgi:hypothetical protein
MLQLAHTPVCAGRHQQSGDLRLPNAPQQVPGAWTRNVIGPDDLIHEAYIAAARGMEKDGVAAITSNCGFTARFQKDVAASVSIPVALSSLLLVPSMVRLLPPGKKLGILTYDATKLGDVHCNGAGWSPMRLPVVIAGIEGSESWAEMAKPDPEDHGRALERDAAPRGSARRTPRRRDAPARVFGVPGRGRAVSARPLLPTVDFSTLQRALIDAVTRGGLPAHRTRMHEALAVLRLNNDPSSSTAPSPARIPFPTLFAT